LLALVILLLTKEVRVPSVNFEVTEGELQRFWALKAIDRNMTQKDLFLKGLKLAEKQQEKPADVQGKT
jgi:hypothetical protein